MIKCNSCQSESIAKILDAGLQPITNRFRKESFENDFFHPLVVNQCQACGLLQLMNPAPVKEVVPRFDWITYSEPEAHLDQLVEEIYSLEGLSKDSLLWGVTFKDSSTLERLNKQGFKDTRLIDKKRDLEIFDSLSSLETIQEYINPKVVNKLAVKKGLADLVVVRHILEHAYDTRQFMEGIKELMNPEGYVVFEVPDCSQALETCDYTTLWEEHILYFTPETFQRTLADNGFSIVSFKIYPNAFENSLVAIVKLSNKKSLAPVSRQVLNSEIERAKKFSNNFNKYSQEIREFLSKSRKEKSKIAIFGAGHLACTFISLFGIKDFLDFCVDDNPNKSGLYLAGTELPIHTSKALLEKNVELCILTLNPINEDKVINKNSSFVNKGGLFLSIFPTSKRAIHNNFA